MHKSNFPSELDQPTLSEVDGVRLNLSTLPAVQAAATAMI